MTLTRKLLCAACAALLPAALPAQAQSFPSKTIRFLVGAPPGAYDRILDFSTPHTGSTFFAPTRPMLQALAQGKG